jgi:LysR substrate binding domain
VSRRLTDYRLFVYGSQAYLDPAPPILGVHDMRNHPIIGYIEEMMFAPQVNYLTAIGPSVGARVRSTSLLAQAHAARGGAGPCILPAFIGSSYPMLVPVLPDKVSLTRCFHMRIHEDQRNAAHVRAVASFIVGEVQRSAAIFRERMRLEARQNGRSRVRLRTGKWRSPLGLANSPRSRPSTFCPTCRKASCVSPSRPLIQARATTPWQSDAPRKAD